MPDPIRADRETMTYDVVIVGAGPAGLSCAIRLKQVSPALSVCVIEKGAEVGAHLLSGAVFEPRALDELIPDWRTRDAPLITQATQDSFVFLTPRKAFHLPTPPHMHNKGNYIISLGALARWLAMQAEQLGVEIFPGFCAAEILYNQSGAVLGIATGDMGRDKTGAKTADFTAGMELHARQTVFAEGCHGALTKSLIRKYDLRAGKSPQTYGLGIKEIWEVDPSRHQKGKTLHTIGWPLDPRTYGGSWIYHMENNLVSVGFVTGLDYQNPYLSPYEEMQRFKTHPAIRDLFTGGRRIAYGARTIVEGGYQSLPKLTFAGGLFIGDCAGFLNVPKIKGNHTAMKSGMLAGEALAELLSRQPESFALECTTYPERLKTSWLMKELKAVRNIRAGFRWGLWGGLLNAAYETMTLGLSPWTLKHHADHSTLKKARDCKPVSYPKPDGILTFDRLTSVSFSNTHHAENQPCHLTLADPALPTARELAEYDGPSQRYCPAGVYEFVKDENGDPKFQINAQNCVHCKTCDIKDPYQNITWTTPQGGDGPNYSNM